MLIKIPQRKLPTQSEKKMYASIFYAPSRGFNCRTSKQMHYQLNYSATTIVEFKLSLFLVSLSKSLTIRGIQTKSEKLGVIKMP